ncbi:MAG: alcohol dehydrogenase catalytic domain-containing protein [Lachnospiraceae bacterium]|nr:alcohol dehydrogenase catalytic domain-containing protein [Lachnospiraceae bacterium]
MKALWLNGPKDLEYGEMPVPEPREGWVRIRVMAASVCGGDVKIYRNGRPGKPIGRRVSGHEFVGVIDKVGEGVTSHKVGDRVSVNPQIYCRECEDCKNGDYNICNHRDMIGGRSYDGGFAEWCVAPEYVLIDIPECIPDVSAAMTEPLGVALHAVRRAGGADLAGRSVVIYGAGPIAMLALECLKYYKASQIIMLDMVRSRLETAKAHGATHVFDAGMESGELIAAVRDITEGRGADAVIDAVCLDATVDNSLHFLRSHGKLVVVGLSKGECNVNFRYMTDHELTLTCSYLYTDDLRDAVAMEAAGQLDIGYIGCPVMPLSSGREMFRILTGEPDRCLKGVLIPDSVMNGQ